MKVGKSAETYQVGAHFKALIKAILVAPSRTLEKFFSFRVSQPRCAYLTKCANGNSNLASLGAYSDQISISIVPALHPNPIPMQKTDEIEAANEAISESFLQFVRRMESDTKGYLKQQMSDWGDGQLQLVRWMGLGPGSMPGSINSARDVCN